MGRKPLNKYPIPEGNGGRGPKVAPIRDPKVDPKPDPLWGAQVLENTMNSNGFGAFDLSEGSSFGIISGAIWGSIPGPPNSGTFQEFDQFN